MIVMPIYEFRCKCGNIFEKLCRSSDTDNPPCPRCGETAEKMFSSFSVGRAAPAASPACGMGESQPGGG